MAESENCDVCAAEVLPDGVPKMAESMYHHLWSVAAADDCTLGTILSELGFVVVAKIVETD